MKLPTLAPKALLSNCTLEAAGLCMPVPKTPSFSCRLIWGVAFATV